MVTLMDKLMHWSLKICVVSRYAVDRGQCDNDCTCKSCLRSTCIATYKETEFMVLRRVDFVVCHMPPLTAYRGITYRLEDLGQMHQHQQQLNHYA